MRDPFRDALCREPGRDPADWDADAAPESREHAAAVCGACPAFDACTALALALGDQASGTWAGVWRPWRDPRDPVLAAFEAIFGASFKQRRVSVIAVEQLTLTFETEEI